MSRCIKSCAAWKNIKNPQQQSKGRSQTPTTIYRSVGNRKGQLRMAPFESIKRPFGAEEKASPIEDRCRINFFMKIARRDHPPIRSGSNDTNRAGFTRKVYLAVTGNRRGEIIPEARDPFFLQEAPGCAIELCNNTTFFDQPEDTISQERCRDVRDSTGVLPDHYAGI